MTKRSGTPLLMGLALLAVTGAAAARERGPMLRPVANPGAVIARELAFAQAAQDNGQWTAFAAFAAPDAVLFVPEMALAQGWLKGRANPPAAVTWQPVEVWSSCDGSLAVSHGAWQGVGDKGWFTTIWQRQQDGNYYWVLDHGASQDQPVPIPEMVPGHVADCPERPARAATAPETRKPEARLPRKPERPTAPFNPLAREGRSADGTLDWSVFVTPQGARTLSIHWIKDGQRSPVQTETVPAPTASPSP